MPYAANVYTVPPGTEATTLTPIDSSDYNAFVADIEAAQNAARPIVAGGTGEQSVIAAYDALNAKGTDIATASSINLTTATGPNLTLTGTDTVSTVTLGEGKVRFVRASGAFQLTASANLVINGSAAVNYTTTAGDMLIFIGGAASVVRVWILAGAITAGYQPKDTDLTTIAGLTATTDNFLQAKASAWASRTPAQVAADLAASASDQETGSSTTKLVTPGVQQRHASAAKFWALVAADGSALTVNYNVSGITDTGAGDLTVTIGTDFSSINWAHQLGAQSDIAAGGANSAGSRFNKSGTKAAGSIQLLVVRGSDGANADPFDPYNVAGYGDQ